MTGTDIKKKTKVKTELDKAEHEIEKSGRNESNGHMGLPLRHKQQWMDSGVKYTAGSTNSFAIHVNMHEGPIIGNE
ncbi:hypothetical protein Tco_0180049 [Tanacetum coccineum]